MCNAAIGGLVVGALGMGMQTMAAKRAAEAENQAADYNASVARNNAAISAQNAKMYETRAKQAKEQGAIEEKQHRLRVSQMVGSQRSALAGSGVVVDQGSGMDIVQDTVKFGELDALNIRYNAAQEAWGYDMEAHNARSTSNIYESQAKFQQNRKVSPMLAAGTTLLNGVTRLDKTTGFISGLFK